MKSLAAFALALIAAPLSAQDAGPNVLESEPIAVGTTHFVEYESGDLREVNVYLPDGYGKGKRSYPVLYLIDGGLDQDFLHVAGTSALNAMWGRSQKVIVVGVQTRDRRAELISDKGNAEERKLFPTAGKAMKFRRYLREKVKPLVEATYRTNGEDAVIGESLAGLFIAETWLVEPDLFGKYAAIDPSLWWHDIALGKSAAGIAGDGKTRGPILLSFSNEGPMTEKGTRLVAAAAGEKGCLLPRPDLTHATAYHILTPQALQFLFPTDVDFDPEWGFEVKCSKKS